MTIKNNRLTIPEFAPTEALGLICGLRVTSYRLTIPEFAPTEAMNKEVKIEQKNTASRFLNSRRLKQSFDGATRNLVIPPHDS